ncbi:hypothetical protein B0T11DRAFT_277381 [Plectosphaerella cucumerina]|uniref:NACHT domain-containing protein n=1 Tax=Plectosphaerella cucumerina TaxID=40658 RepID=A0A8K0TSH7_9PEZI|nr:hypothetical protein B0T11DRAFT_277381 [Plectosphaerella cucumerina]
MLAVSQAGSLKPEIRLQQALREYESLLTKDQRQLYNTRVRSGRAPDMADVIQATSEIDREARKQRGIHKCAAPRLMKVLTACQRFAAIGDVLIGGSQNLIACGVWSAVRLSLQISAGNGAFFDKLSLLIMDIGRTAPINEEIGLLATDSPELQSLVTEYMLRVVSICKEMVKLSNKSSLAQLASSISGFDATFGQLSDEVKTIGHVIDKQVALLSAKTNVSEAKENKASRALLRGLSSEARRQAREVKAVRFLKELCTHQQDFDAVRANVRQQGTVDWIFKHPEYTKWKTEPVSSTLNLVGKLGSGKSVVMANVVDDLHLKLSVPDIQKTRPAVAYLFYSHGLRQVCIARHMVGSLALQILRSSGLRSAVEAYLEDRQLPDLLHPTVASIVSTLSSILSSIKTPPEVFIVLDGLEECNPVDLRKIVQALRSWGARSILHLVFSSKNPLDTFEQAPSPAIRILMSQNNDDLTRFISSEAKRRGEICQRSPELCQLVADVLSTGADGMYLWASLMLDLVFPMQADQPTVLAIEDLLEELPKSLSEVYEKLLARVKDGVRTRRLFQLVTVACRPLTVGEAIDALSVSPGKLVREPMIVLARPTDLLHDLGGHLLHVEEENDTIHFIHESAVSHLLVLGRSSEFGFNINEAQHHMGGVCTTYLSLPEFNGNLQRTTLETGSLAVAPSGLVTNAIQTTLPKPVQKTVGSLLSRMSNRKSRQFDLTRVINELAASSPVTQYHLFHPYCKTHWLDHTKHFRISARGADRLWIRRMETPGTLNFPWGLDSMSRLDWSLHHGHPSVLTFAVEAASKSADKAMKIDFLRRIVNHHEFHHLFDFPQTIWQDLRDASSEQSGDFVVFLIRLASEILPLRSAPKYPLAALIAHMCRSEYLGRRGHIRLGIPSPTPLGAACEISDAVERRFLVGHLLGLEADPNVAFLDSNGSVTLPLVHIIEQHQDELQDKSWQASTAGLLISAGADVNASTGSRPYCPLIATWSSTVQIEQLKTLLGEGADPFAECPAVGMTVVQHLVTKSGLGRDAMFDILSTMLLHRQHSMDGSEAYTHLIRIVADFLDEERSSLYRPVLDWKTDFDVVEPNFRRQAMSIALQVDGLYPTVLETSSSAHLASLMAAHGKDPVQGPTRSLMRLIYTYDMVTFFQILRRVPMTDQLMDQLLHWIVAFGRLETIQEMVWDNVRREQILKCRFLLHRAVLTAHLTGNTESLTFLLDLGVHVDVPGPHYGETALFWAVWLNNQSLVYLLLERGAQSRAALSDVQGDVLFRGSFGPVLNRDHDNSHRVRGSTHLHEYCASSELRGLQPLTTAVLLKNSEMVNYLSELGA